MVIIMIYIIIIVIVPDAGDSFMIRAWLLVETGRVYVP